MTTLSDALYEMRLAMLCSICCNSYGKEIAVYLGICINEITDDSCDVTLEHTFLVQFRMDYNRITAEKSIFAALHFNDTLEKL